jgi:1-acyl-sn-glycerol-3-phosphate acyltransferase
MVRTVLDMGRTVVGLFSVAVYTLFVGSYVIVASLIVPKARHFDACIKGWGKIFGFATGTRTLVEGAEKLDPDSSYIVVSNHLSNLDPPLHIATLPIPIRFLAKKELFRVPILGRAMKSVGMIETDRQAHASAHRAINEQVAEVIAMGKSLIIYPEGHRSRDSEMQPFKKGAFRIAVDNGLPVVPVTIAGTDRAWHAGDKLVHGGRSRMIIHDPIPTTDLGADDIGELRDRVRALIASTYDEIRAPASG